LFSFDYLELKVIADRAAATATVIRALTRAHLGVWLAIDEINPKLWAAAIAVIVGVLKWCEVLAIDTEFHGDLQSPRRGI